MFDNLLQLQPHPTFNPLRSTEARAQLSHNANAIDLNKAWLQVFFPDLAPAPQIWHKIMGSGTFWLPACENARSWQDLAQICQNAGMGE